MPRVFSLYAREQFNKGEIDDVPVLLVTIEHETLDEPVRLSSDPTELLSMNPLAYGTVSNGQSYSYVLQSIIVPDDIEGSPPSTQIVLENVTSGMADVVRSIATPATVSLAIVWASAPDAVEEEYTDFRIVSASYDAGQLTLEISREPVTALPLQAGRMTKGRFPGLHR